MMRQTRRAAALLLALLLCVGGAMAETAQDMAAALVARVIGDDPAAQADAPQTELVARAMQTLLNLGCETEAGIAAFTILSFELEEDAGGNRTWIIAMGADTGSADDGYIFAYYEKSGALKSIEFRFHG